MSNFLGSVHQRELWRFFQANAKEYPVPACLSTLSEQTLNYDYNPHET